MARVKRPASKPIGRPTRADEKAVCRMVVLLTPEEHASVAQAAERGRYESVSAYVRAKLGL